MAMVGHDIRSAAGDLLASFWRSPEWVGDTRPMDLILALSASGRRHLQEIGLIVCVVGGVAVILSGAFGLRSMSRFAERTMMIVAGVLLFAGFIVQLVAVRGRV
jgi:hypothetical protein